MSKAVLKLQNNILVNIDLIHKVNKHIGEIK